MASEITVSATVAVTITGATGQSTFNLVQDLAGNAFVSNVQTAPANGGGTIIDMGSVNPPGWLFCKNLHATANVQVQLSATTNTDIIATLLPGEACLIKPGTISVYLESATATQCDVQCVAIEL